MRTYQAEGWHEQLQGRSVVGHYSYSALFYPSAGATRWASLRNPLLVPSQASKQRHVHVIRAACSVGIQVSDDVGNDVQAIINKGTEFTATDSAGGSAIADADFSRVHDKGFASVLVGRSSISGGGVSGGTVTVNAPLVNAQLVSPASTTNAEAYASRDWVATFAPLLITGDQGIVFTFGNGTTAPGVPAIWTMIEWLESVKV